MSHFDDTTPKCEECGGADEVQRTPNDNHWLCIKCLALWDEAILECWYWERYGKP